MLVQRNDDILLFIVGGHGFVAPVQEPLAGTMFVMLVSVLMGV